MKSHKLLAAAAFLTLSVACGSPDESFLSANSSSCQLAPNCKQDLPKLPKPQGFSTIYKKTIAKLGNPNHRALDVMAVAGTEVTLHAKFTYGLFDNDLKEEPVDIYLSSNCTSALKKIGTVETSIDDQNPSADNVKDSGGRIFSKLSDFGIRNLPVGRHRIVFVVPADNSTTDMYVNVISPNSEIVLTDIDGTLTTSEMAAAVEIIGIQPPAHKGAAEMMQTLYAKGHAIFYLTARPEWLMPHTRAWLKAKGFPPGTIHTTTKSLGAQGEAASEFKIAEIAELKAHTGIVPSYAFGNKESDVKAFGDGDIASKTSYFFKLKGDAKGGVVHSDYTQLAKKFKSLPTVCR
jgi:phosphatidate phosphatase PAH1